VAAVASMAEAEEAFMAAVADSTLVVTVAGCGQLLRAAAASGVLR